MGKLKELWTTTVWFKIFLLFLVLGSVAGAVLQYGIGLNPINGGTIVMEEELATLPINSIKVYTGIITEPNNAIAFATDGEVEFYLFDFTLLHSINASEIAEIANLAKFHEENITDFDTWPDFEAAVSLVIITPPDHSTQFAMAMREFSNSEMTQITQFVWGSNILNAMVWAIGIFVVVIYLVPWVRNRFQPPQRV
ncbi:MAG: hypothetical protein E4G98_03340 [Promethearchaeota archaeon]|nr:MAG: hypothetical protein E4G98_03340 [Candidatus Lokiarchaeota archaeon]